MHSWEHGRGRSLQCGLGTTLGRGCRCGCGRVVGRDWSVGNELIECMALGIVEGVVGTTILGVAGGVALGLAACRREPLAVSLPRW